MNKKRKKSVSPDRPPSVSSTRDVHGIQTQEIEMIQAQIARKQQQVETIQERIAPILECITPTEQQIGMIQTLQKQISTIQGDIKTMQQQIETKQQQAITRHQLCSAQNRRTSDGKSIWCYTLSCFNIGEQLGYGNFGSVCKGTDKFANCVAIKTINNSKYAQREIEILATNPSHSNIITFMGVLVDVMPKDGEQPIYSGYVMEFMPLGTLHDQIHTVTNTYDLTLAYKWINQIASAVQYLHENNIIHRDVKPRNILLATKEHVKLADFGMARIIANKMTESCGTESYMAPEVRTGEYGTAVDVYSLGVVIWEILHRKNPCTLLENLKKRTVVIPNIDTQEQEGEYGTMRLIHRCLKESPTDRPTMQYIVGFFKAMISNNEGHHHSQDQLVANLDLDIYPEMNTTEDQTVPQGNTGNFECNRISQYSTIEGGQLSGGSSDDMDQ